MEITADFKNRNDGLDDDVIRYFKNETDDSYFYELYVLIDGRKASVTVLSGGVSVDYQDAACETIHTNINPGKIYPNHKKLTWDEIDSLIEILQNTGCEGKVYYRDEMEAMYQQLLPDMVEDDEE